MVKRGVCGADGGRVGTGIVCRLQTVLAKWRYLEEGRRRIPLGEHTGNRGEALTVLGDQESSHPACEVG